MRLGSANWFEKHSNIEYKNIRKDKKAKLHSEHNLMLSYAEIGNLLHENKHNF